MATSKRVPALPPAPDLDTQLESLLDQVWDSEARERMNDRIDNAGRVEDARAKQRARRKKADDRRA